MPTAVSVFIRKDQGIYVYVVPFSYYQEDSYQEGFGLFYSVEFYAKVKPQKSLSYAERRLFWFKAQVCGFEEALVSSYDGIIGGSRSSLFVLKDNAVFSPESDLLFEGITGRIIVNLLSKLGLEFSKKEIMG